jgi:predicted branched-subunit amino acid permease
VSAGTPAASAAREAFRLGRRAILPFLPGAFAWGMISGVAMVKGGLAVPWAIAMSLLVYAGSAQLAALPLIVAGTPLWVIVATGLITNLRFVIYSAALRPYFAALLRVALGYFMTDFTFVRFMRAAQEGTMPDQHRDAWFGGVCSSNWITWQVSALTGIIGASYVPTEWGLEFTGTLALVALVGPSLNARPAVLGAIVAAAIAVFTHSLPFKLGLFCGALAGIIAATLSDAVRPRDPPLAEGA